MRKSKIELSTIKVKSFTTLLTSQKSQTHKGALNTVDSRPVNICSEYENCQWSDPVQCTET